MAATIEGLGPRISDNLDTHKRVSDTFYRGDGGFVISGGNFHVRALLPPLPPPPPPPTLSPPLLLSWWRVCVCVCVCVVCVFVVVGVVASQGEYPAKVLFSPK